MIQFLFYLYQNIQDNQAYDTGYKVGQFLGKYGIYIGATLLVLIILIILYIKKHRSSKQRDE